MRLKRSTNVFMCKSTSKQPHLAFVHTVFTFCLSQRQHIHLSPLKQENQREKLLSEVISSKNSNNAAEQNMLHVCTRINTQQNRHVKQICQKKQQERNATVLYKEILLMHLDNNFCWVNTYNFKGPYNLRFLMQLCSNVSRTSCQWSAKTDSPLPKSCHWTQCIQPNLQMAYL